MQVAVTNSRLVQNTLHDDDENYFVSLYGSERVAEQRISPTSSSTSGGTTVFSFQPPSTGTIMDKCVLLQVEVELDFAATAAAVPGIPVPRAWPLNNAIQTLQVTINGTTITSSPAQRKAFMERIHTSKELRRRFASFTPTFRDNDYDYDLMATTREAYNPFARKKIMSHELSRYEWSPNNERNYDGAQPAGKRSQLNRFVFTEPLFIDVFETTKVEGIHNINKIDISINWVPNIYVAMFGNARVPGGGAAGPSSAGAVVTVPANRSVLVTGANVEYGTDQVATLKLIDQKQSLLVRYVTPSSRPKELLTVPYVEYTRYNKIGESVFGSLSVAADASRTNKAKIVFDAIRETMVPRYGILLVKRVEAATADYLADTMFQIDAINIQVDNMQGLLSGATPQQLWQMSTRNGLDVSWHEWRHQGQCVVIFEFGEDIGGLIPNVNGQLNLQVTVDIANPFRYDHKPEAELYLSKDGFLEITPNQMMVKLGIMRDEVRLAIDNENILASEENDNRVGDMVEGAGFKSGFRKFRKFGNAVAKGAMTGIDVASKLANIALAAKKVTGRGKLGN
jgi:hypothetical protein